MKRLNYYQVHKNKKSKIVFEQRHKYVKYMMFMAKKSFALRDSLTSLQYSIESFMDRERIGKVGIIISIDSGGGTI